MKKLIWKIFFKFKQGTCPWMAFAWNFFGIFMIFLGGFVGQIIYREYIVFRGSNISCSLANGKNTSRPVPEPLKRRVQRAPGASTGESDFPHCFRVAFFVCLFAAVYGHEDETNADRLTRFQLAGLLSCRGRRPMKVSVDRGQGGCTLSHTVNHHHQVTAVRKRCV